MKVPKISFQTKYNKPQIPRQKVSQPLMNETKGSKITSMFKELRNKNFGNLNSKEIIALCTSIGLISPIPLGFVIGFLAGTAIATYQKIFNK